MVNVRVAEAIAAKARALAAKVELSQEWVLRRLMRIADADPADFMSWGPGGARLKASDDLTEERRQCIDSFYAVGTHLAPRLHGKLKALRALGEHLRLFAPEGTTTQNFLVMHSHSKEELAELEEVSKPTTIAGLKLHLGD